jgi:hypothetical protein
MNREDPNLDNLRKIMRTYSTAEILDALRMEFLKEQKYHSSEERKHSDMMIDTLENLILTDEPDYFVNKELSSKIAQEAKKIDAMFHY